MNQNVTDSELNDVSGVVSAANKTVIIKSVVVQQNGTTVKDYTKVIRR